MFRRLRSIDFHTGEKAMHQAARPHTLHDFLPNVTTFIEIDGMRLLGFLRERGGKNIFAVARLKVLETHNTRRLGRN